MGTDVQRYADSAMFTAAPMRKGTGVYLLWMTPDPMGAVAAMARMYKGVPTYSLRDITDDERRAFWDDALATHLKAPLEAVKLHFFIEGVDRSFTHQMVRQRTAVYAQESLRFAVKEGFASEAIVPPSLLVDPDEYLKPAGMVDDPGVLARVTWDGALADIEAAYEKLIALGIPAEDARSLLPHCVATRLNYVTDLRALADHAGNRMCSQAQLHWRMVFAQIVGAIANYPAIQPDGQGGFDRGPVREADAWQFPELASSALFRPVCYQLNQCPFNASFDRFCSIRPAVERYTADSVPSKDWDPVLFKEVMVNPKAATR